MSDEAYFFLRIAMLGGIISWAILRFWMPKPKPEPQPEEPEDEHLHI